MTKNLQICSQKAIIPIEVSNAICVNVCVWDFPPRAPTIYCLAILTSWHLKIPKPAWVPRLNSIDEKKKFQKKKDLFSLAPIHRKRHGWRWMNYCLNARNLSRHQEYTHAGYSNISFDKHILVRRQGKVPKIRRIFPHRQTLFFVSLSVGNAWRVYNNNGVSNPAFTDTKMHLLAIALNGQLNSAAKVKKKSITYKI